MEHGEASVFTLFPPYQYPTKAIDPAAQSPEDGKHTGITPFPTAPAGCGAGTDVRTFQRIPLHAGAQHQQNAIHCNSVGNTGPVTA
jgi:hypothetical protein